MLGEHLPPSSAANNENGFHVTSVYLRSILMHPIGILLTSLLNEVSLSEKNYDFWTDLKNVKNWLIYSSCNVRDNILSSAMAKWDQRSEKDLTNKIEEIIKGEIEKKTLEGYGTVEDEGLLTIEKGKEVGGGREGIVDFVISKKCTDANQSKRSVVMIIEFGISSDMWWQKMSQVLTYFKLVNQEEGKKYVVDQPVLLTVITMKKPDSNDASNADPVARFGVFLCIPKSENECRLALLWRTDTFTDIDASKQFGKILYAAQLCAELSKHLASTIMKPGNETSYEYLGPNCCRIGYYLYRSYDNRLRPTERRPDLYETEDTDLFGTCDPILEIADTTNEALLLPFGHRQLPDTIEAINWLWAYRGRVKIIATQFHDGIHIAKRPKHFLPIVEHLEALHKKEYVHGDIRAYNMVLKYDDSVNNNVPVGRLIDFDYGGIVLAATADNENVQKPMYPSGYVYRLGDGVRPGRPGEAITFEHDWRALGSVILGLYTLVPGSTHEGKAKMEIPLNRMRDAFIAWNDRDFLLLIQNAFTAVGKECTIIPSENPGPFLRAYLELAQDNGFVLKPTENFKGDMTDCNLMNGQDSKGARR